MHRIFLGTMAAAAALLLSSCAGYKLGPVKPAELDHVQKIAIPAFVNKTLEPRLSVAVTNAVIKQFQLDQTYQLVDVDEADAILRGEIKQVRRKQFRANRANRLFSRELQFEIVVEFYIEDAINGDLMLEELAAGASNLNVGGNFQLTERQALTDAAYHLSIDILSKTAEGW